MDEGVKRIIADIEEHNLGPDDKFKFHCTMCGRCCTHRDDILLTPRDIYNMSKELGIKPEELAEKYCEIYVGPDSRFPIVRILPSGNVQRCPMLKNRKCMVHKAKPTICGMYPLGRGIKIVGEDVSSIKTEDTFFFFPDPGCGNDSQEHTVREWLGEFGIPVEDVFFVLWQKTFVMLSNIFQEMEKKTNAEVMTMMWRTTFHDLYIAYDMGQDFQQQFERNAKKVTDAVNSIFRMI